MSYIFYILLGFLPSLIWLSYYLKKDKRPEPNSLVLRVFIWGMLLGPLAVVLELLLSWPFSQQSSFLPLASQLPIVNGFNILITAAITPALVEETLKFSIIKGKFLKDTELDEPTDIMLYLIIAGLGFAAVENLLIVFRIPFVEFKQALIISGFRFLGATLVHALSSAIAGYYLAKAVLMSSSKVWLITKGLLFAILFHSCYNYLIIQMIGQETVGKRMLFLFLITTMLVTVASLILVYFRRLSKQKSICL